MVKDDEKLTKALSLTGKSIYTNLSKRVGLMQEQTNNPQPISETSRPDSPNTVQNPSSSSQSQENSDAILENTYPGQLQVNSPAVESGQVTTVRADSLVIIMLSLALFGIVLLAVYRTSVKRSSSKKVKTTSEPVPEKPKQAPSQSSKATPKSKGKTKASVKKTGSKKKSKKSTKKKK